MAATGSAWLVFIFSSFSRKGFVDPPGVHTWKHGKANLAELDWLCNHFAKSDDRNDPCKTVLYSVALSPMHITIFFREVTLDLTAYGLIESRLAALGALSKTQIPPGL